MVFRKRRRRGMACDRDGGASALIAGTACQLRLDRPFLRRLETCRRTGARLAIVPAKELKGQPARQPTGPISEEAKR